MRARLDGIRERIRRESPRLAALEYPRPLTGDQARRALDAGTVLLAWSVGTERTRLFILRAGTEYGTTGRLEVVTIPAGSMAIAGRVNAFRALLQQPGRPAGRRAEIVAAGGELYDLLLRPAERALDEARHVVLLPDRALHVLPFAALVRRAPGAPAQFFAQAHAYVTAPSATAYSELKSIPRATDGPLMAVAFGDPKYPFATTLARRRSPDSVTVDEPDGTTALLIDADADGIAAGSPSAEPSTTSVTSVTSSEDAEVQSLLRSGARLARLPASRDEASAIARLYAPQSAAWLGPDATERRAKTLDPRTRIVHFAVHGILNERFPLNSALALTIPDRPKEGEDNGLLQAWEILEHVRLNADLVTLSACDTAVGAEAGGEGLLTLARAFHFAGARSVLASLWSVDDRATARLMRVFYEKLHAGQPPAEALRLAQVSLLESTDFADPGDWAGFSLSGV